jgi:hypothetical protein
MNKQRSWAQIKAEYPNEWILLPDYKLNYSSTDKQESVTISKAGKEFFEKLRSAQDNIE